MNQTIETLDLASLGIKSEEPAEIWLLRQECGLYACGGGSFSEWRPCLACFRSSSSAAAAARAQWAGDEPVRVSFWEARTIAKIVPHARGPIVALAWFDDDQPEIFHYVR